MIIQEWKKLSNFNLAAGKFAVPWMKAHEDLSGSRTYLKLKVTKGEWKPMGGLDACNADGLTGESFPDDRLFVPDCPVGALVGRIGGSSATLKNSSPTADAGESKAFAVGLFSIIKLPNKVVGPLFLGFNIMIRPIEITSELEVEISVASELAAGPENSPPK